MCCKEVIKKTGGDSACFDKKTSAKEKNRTFTIEYPKGEQFCRIHVDDCLVKSKTVQKCDYAFVRCSTKDVYYIELKGLKIDKAFDQIVETINTHFLTTKDKVYGFIIATKTVPQQRQKSRILKAKFAKNHGVKLEISSIKHIHRII